MNRVWVIGGTQGIGDEIRKELGERGYAYVATSEKDCDVRHGLEIAHYYSSIKPVGIVYVAGINHLMPAAEYEEGIAEDIMNVNLMGFMRLIHVVAFHLKDHSPRHIVAISSDAATTPMRNSMAYCSSKAALNMAVRCAARELAPRVQVNAIAPGQVADTPHTEAVDKQVSAIKGWSMEETIANSEALIPTGRRATKREVAQMVCLTLSAPAQLTGAIININGGK
jgi:NAD(P)-dependent dehydrogenase (short-subunit alcohol dehydrogenase family)